MTIDELEDWINAEIERCETEIDAGGPFYDLSTRQLTLEEVLSKVGDLE